MWQRQGKNRPEFAVEPGPGQESVWDYPRPPVLDAEHRLIEVKDGKLLVARTTKAFRVLETASPPTFYIPPDDVDFDRLEPMPERTVCEWKGMAIYWALSREPAHAIAWSYPRPRARFVRIRDYVAFYPARVACFLDAERVRAQPGRFYGGWITNEIVGPFKGEPGTLHW